MNVKELIKALSKLDPMLPVGLLNPYGEIVEALEAHVCDAGFDDEGTPDEWVLIS